MPFNPGVYRMLDAKGDALYVGKARSLKKRVTAYTQLGRLDERLRRMVNETVAMEVITTHTEAEALLLEANLIKRLKPRFNIVLRDDKSYPWLMLTEDHPFPQIAKHRGAQVRKGSYWGPFASAWAVNQTVTAMQRVFLLRSCADTVFANRTRPCLLYQIRRCSAPCVGRIGEADYGRLVGQAKAFLAGKSATVQQELAAEMEHAAEALEFEHAAAVRDRIRALTFVQGNDVVNPASLQDADVIAAWQIAGQTCVQVFFVRGGRNNGNRAFFPTHAEGRGGRRGARPPSSRSSTTTSRRRPACWSTIALPEQDLVAEALSLKADRKVEILVPQRGEKRAVVQHAEINAREALERKLAESRRPGEAAGRRRAAVRPARAARADRGLRQLPHHGHQPVRRDDRRRAGGLHARRPIASSPSAARSRRATTSRMMREVLQRRFARALKEQEEGAPATDWPDLVLIDGGAGQLSAAREVLRISACRREAGGDRQGPGSRRRARVVPHRWRGAVPAAAARSGAVFPAAPARRGASLRHHHAPRRALEEHPAERAGRDPRHRRRPQARAAEPFRFGARGEDGGAGGPGGGAGHQPRDGAAGVCAFPSGGADGGCFVAAAQIRECKHPPAPPRRGGYRHYV